MSCLLQIELISIGDLHSPLRSESKSTLALTCTIPIGASGMFSVPILLIYCNDRRIIQHYNMDMKFAALLLFVGVTSATWCWQDPAGYDNLHVP